jgi:integrase
MSSIKTDGRQTIPLSSSQFAELLAATDTYDADPDREVLHEGHLLKTLFLLMRWSGLRIGDCLTMARASLRGNSLDLITRKTKAHYRGTLPDEVASLLRALPHGHGTHPDYFFWSVDSTYETLTSSWSRAIRGLNRHLNYRDDHGRPIRFHSHMLRDTFAVELLLAGVALEDVSRLLTHKSVRITEKYYAPWIRARQVQLENKLLAAMRKMGATVSDGGAK